MPDYSSLYQSAGNTFNVDPLLAQAVGQVESSGNPNAVSRDAQGNPVAHGLMQITDPNLQRLNVPDPYNPQFNIPAGTRVLDEALTTANGNVPLALRIYQGGPDQSKWGPVNAAYPAKVAAAYQKLKAAQPGTATPPIPSMVIRPSGGAAAAPQDDVDAFLTGQTSPTPAISANGVSAAPDAIDAFLTGAGALAPPAPVQAAVSVDPITGYPVDGAGKPVAGAGTTLAGNSQGTLSPGSAQSATNIASAAAQGAKAGFGNQPFGLSPQSQNALVQAGVYNGPNGYNPLKAINRAVINPLAAGADLALRTGGALLGAYQGGVAQAGQEVGAPLLGRDLAALPEAFPTGDVSGGTRLPAPVSVPAANPLMREISPAAHEALDAPLPAAFRDNPGVTVPSMVGPASHNPLVSGPPRAAAPDTAPVPQSVGAASSRDLSPPGTIPPQTPEQKLTNLGKSVTQSAEDRAGPQLQDNTVYVPGVERPLAAREFSPQNSLDDKTLRATDPVYRAQQEAVERGNNQTMVDLLGKDAGDANALKAAHDERDEVAPPAQQLFAGEKPVDAAPLVQQIDNTLAGPDGKRAAIVRTLSAVRDSLFDADGNLENLPSQLYGARKNITDLLKKGVGEGADDVRASKSILTGLLDNMDPIINEGAPKYQAYLDQFHEASQPINQMEFLQKYQTGSKKLTNVDGYLQLSKVQKMLDDVYQGQKASGINPAKSLTDDQVQNIVNVRNELAAQSLKDRLAKVKGSDTAQQTNRAGVLGDGPLGTAVKGAAEMGAHALLFHTTGGIGNAAMAIHRAVVKPAREASKAAKLENALVARKNALLSTQPNPLSGN